jgi:transcriptional regulator with XRE-family HTH domain
MAPPTYQEISQKRINKMDQSRKRLWKLFSKWAKRMRKKLGLTNEDIAAGSGLPIELVSKAVDLKASTLKESEEILDFIQMNALAVAFGVPKKILREITRIFTAHYFKTPSEIEKLIEPLSYDIATLDLEERSFLSTIIHLTISDDIADAIQIKAVEHYVNKKLYQHQEEDDLRKFNWKILGYWVARRRDHLGITDEDIAQKTSIPVEKVNQVTETDLSKLPNCEEPLEFMQLYNLAYALNAPTKIIDKLVEIITFSFHKDQRELLKMFNPLSEEIVKLENQDLQFVLLFILLQFPASLTDKVIAEIKILRE